MMIAYAFSPSLLICVDKFMKSNASSAYLQGWLAGSSDDVGGL